MKRIVDRVKDGAKSLLRPKDRDVIKETFTEVPPKVEDIVRREKDPIFAERIAIKDMLFNMLNQINMNKVTGFYNFAKWEHEDQYLDDCKEFVNRMEILVPDEEFRRDIIVAEREPDEVQVGHAMLAACQRLMTRKKVGLAEKYVPSEYEPDETRLTEREYPDRDYPDRDESGDDDEAHT